MKIKKISPSNFIFALVCLGALSMIFFPEIISKATKEAISLWLNAIVPTMLPFFLAANYIKRTEIMNRIPIKYYPAVMGFLSGYPMGAGICGDCCRNGIITKEETYSLLSYSMITSPAFIIGAAGTEFLGSFRAGIMIATAHYLGGIFNGLFFFKGIKQVSARKENREIQNESMFNALSDAILDSFKSLAIILAYIVIFMIITDVLQFSGFFSLLSMGCPKRFAMISEAFLKGVIEMTVGSSSMIYCKNNMVIKIVVMTFIISFGGFSVIGQSMSMLRNCNIKTKKIFIMKISHGILSSFIAFTFALTCQFML